MKRVVLIVLDSVGIGEMPDADLYSDVGSHTLGNINSEIGLNISNMKKIGIGNIENSMLDKVENPSGSYGKAAEKSMGKDTTTGHWEMAGLQIENPFPTYPNGFPDEIIKPFEEQTGKKALYNKTASGTEILKQYGAIHMQTGDPIVYTSADSVFQIAAHEDIISIEELYDMCNIARKLLTGEHGVGRVIARPFIGSDGNFVRTKNRKDFALPPFSDTMLDLISSNNQIVAGVGKIEDIFNNRGLTHTNHTTDNKAGIDATINYMKNLNDSGLIFTNLVDFDMQYGHRNNPKGYADALEYFDNRLPDIISTMNSDDILIITADHGCDPTTASTDHSREYIPILVYGKNILSKDLGIRNTFADISATILDYLDIENKLCGQSFLPGIMQSEEKS